MEPIATYAERMIQVQRLFMLYPDRVVVQAKWLFRGSFQTEVSLAGMDPEFRTFFVRNKWFKHGILLTVIGIAIILVLGRKSDMTKMNPFVMAGMLISLLGLAVSAMTRRRVLFVRFSGTGGKNRLDIGQAGPDRKNFEKFVNQISKQIKKTRKQ